MSTELQRDYSAMEAGAQMDAAVAIHVMEWRAIISPTAPRDATEQDTWERGVNGRGLLKMSLWNPSEDIVDGWAVLKCVRKWPQQMRYNFTLRLKWAIEERTGQNVPDYCVILAVEPVDICRAALNTVARDKHGASAP